LHRFCDMKPTEKSPNSLLTRGFVISGAALGFSQPTNKPDETFLFYWAPLGSLLANALVNIQFVREIV